MKHFPVLIAVLLAGTPVFAQWQKIDVPFEPLDISAVDSNTLWCFNNNSGTMARTTDGGSTWSEHGIPNAQGFLLGSFISAIDSSRAWVSFRHYNSGFNYVYRTVDGGQSWQAFKPVALDNVQIINFQKFYDFNSGVLLSHDFNNHLFVHKTTSGGQSWTTKTLPINGSHLGTATYGDKHIWFYTGSGELWRTKDGGVTWSKVQTPLIATAYGLQMEFADSLNGWAFKDHYFDQLYRTTDGGATWSPVFDNNNPAPSKAFVWGLTMVPGLPGAWAIGCNDGTIYTLDNGNSWILETNYPDYDFRRPVFLNHWQGWGVASSGPAVFKWQGALNDPALKGCIEFIGPLTGKLRRSECNKIWFQGSIRVDIAADPGIHFRAQLFYPDNATFPVTQKQLYNNVLTGCPDCPLSFIPDAGQTTIGELRFDLPVNYAFDTAQAILCTLSPTNCQGDTSNTIQFHTGYFANWFHRECFRIDTSDCAIELQTNACGNDTNQYVIYYQVQNGPAVLGNRYEKNPSYEDRVRFYIYAYGNLQNSTCYAVIDTLYTCGVSKAVDPLLSSGLDLRLAPNPATDILQISCNHLPESQPPVIRIRNAAGALVWNGTFPLGASSHVLENLDLPGGFYVVELWSAARCQALKKLIVMK